LADVAFSAALEHDLSVYDACYLVLAEAAEAILVTSDADLAAASSRVELLV
jgi:predicted nucleic acid-binding protein